MGRKEIISQVSTIFVVMVMLFTPRTLLRTNNIGDSPAVRKLRDNYKLSPINPRDVFLLYATSLIMETYTRYCIPISTDALGTDSQFPGTFASICHLQFPEDVIDKILRITIRPAVLFVSIRDGYDWLKSYTASAQSQTAAVVNGPFMVDENVCSRFSYFTIEDKKISKALF